jgi:alkanesulfonate monooxygenase SsuD/methylene tetrahydromethanopterin reductase-like flavin-dependent oxidoreductase (luciferase family)
VLNTTLRNPALLAKMAETVDEISGGRVILGVGAGDARYEHAAFGYPFDHRVGRFAEAVTIIGDLLRHGASNVRGTYYEVHNCALLPRGPRREGLPILIGSLANGPRMLRLVVEHADIWNGWLVHSRSSADAVPPLRDAIDAACLAQGRDPATLARTVAIRVALLGQPAPTGEALEGSADEIADALRAHAAAGISHVQVWLTPDTIAGVEAFAPVLELLDRG